MKRLVQRPRLSLTEQTEEDLDRLAEVTPQDVDRAGIRAVELDAQLGEMLGARGLESAEDDDTV